MTASRKTVGILLVIAGVVLLGLLVFLQFKAMPSRYAHRHVNEMVVAEVFASQSRGDLHTGRSLQKRTSEVASGDTNTAPATPVAQAARQEPKPANHKNTFEAEWDPLTDPSTPERIKADIRRHGLPPKALEGLGIPKWKIVTRAVRGRMTNLQTNDAVGVKIDEDGSVYVQYYIGGEWLRLPADYAEYVAYFIPPPVALKPSENELKRRTQ